MEPVNAPPTTSLPAYVIAVVLTFAAIVTVCLVVVLWKYTGNRTKPVDETMEAHQLCKYPCTFNPVHIYTLVIMNSVH